MDLQTEILDTYEKFTLEYIAELLYNKIEGLMVLRKGLQKGVNIVEEYPHIIEQVYPLTSNRLEKELFDIPHLFSSPLEGLYSCRVIKEPIYIRAPLSSSRTYRIKGYEAPRYYYAKYKVKYIADFSFVINEPVTIETLQRLIEEGKILVLSIEKPKEFEFIETEEFSHYFRSFSFEKGVKLRQLPIKQGLLSLTSIILGFDQNMYRTLILNLYTKRLTLKKIEEDLDFCIEEIKYVVEKLENIPNKKQIIEQLIRYKKSVSR